MRQRCDVAVVGAGIVGLGVALAAARRGRRVRVYERHPRAQSASIRNFGMIWPIGQSPGVMHERALRSRAQWLEIAPAADFWLAQCGSLHLAYHDDERAVLHEFLEQHGAAYGAQWLEPDAVLRRSPGVRGAGLRGAMWSAQELCIDPREAIARLPAWLASALGVEFSFNTPVIEASPGLVRTSAGEICETPQTYICSGAEFALLHPAAFARSGLRRCKLQMMRTAPQPNGWRLGPHLAAGSTLRHYESFAGCAALPALRARFAQAHADMDRWGVHVMASQNGRGEIVIGDSHEYADDFDPDERADVERLILDYLETFLTAPSLRVAARWHGVYVKPPLGQTALVQEVAEGVTIVNGPGGTGMTVSLALTEDVLSGALATSAP